MPYAAPRLAAFVTDLAKIQLMKMLQPSAHGVAARPASSVPRKKASAVPALGDTAYITRPYRARNAHKSPLSEVSVIGIAPSDVRSCRGLTSLRKIPLRDEVPWALLAHGLA